MTRPASVKIGGNRYRIVYKRQMDDDGECSFSTLTISIKDGQPSTSCGNTILHEVLHAIWSEYNLPADIEEHAVTCLANGLAQVAQDNKRQTQQVLDLIGGKSAKEKTRKA